MNLHDFENLAAAQSYSVTKERMVSLDMVVSLLTQNDCVSSLSASADEKSKGFWLAVSSGVSEFNVMNSHPVGQLQQGLLAHLVSVGAVNQAFSDAIIGYANQTSYPYSTTTQAEYDAAVAKAAITETEVSYPSESYIITTGNQGIDVSINTDVDCAFTVYLAVCNDSGNQHMDANYLRYEQPVGQVNAKGGKAILSLSARKVRQYNKLYVKPSEVCTFTASVTTNRG